MRYAFNPQIPCGVIRGRQFDSLSRLELVSTNDVSVFRYPSRGGTLSDKGASVKLKPQNLLKLSILCFEISRKNYKRIYFIKKVVFPKLKHCNSSTITD